MLSPRWVRGSLLAAALTVLVACGSSGDTATTVDVGKGTLNGSGSSFVGPFFTKAFFQYSKKYPDVTINYQTPGSGAGIKDFTDGKTDFGASDVPMTATEITAAGGEATLVQIPSTLGVVSVAYNLSGVDKLYLDGPTLADIFKGKIKKWDDPAIKNIPGNSGLPAKDIVVVHRADGSGTTYAFTDYLNTQSADWKGKQGKTVNGWADGSVASKGNDGVAGSVQQTEGSIGYVELAFVIQAKMHQAFIKNKAGKFLQASTDGATAAAGQAKDVSPTSFSIVDQGGDASYPITTFSWVILRKDQKDANQGKMVVNLFNWLVTDGQQYGKDLQYAPLPTSARSLATSTLKTVTTGGKAILA